MCAEAHHQHFSGAQALDGLRDDDATRSPFGAEAVPDALHVQRLLPIVKLALELQAKLLKNGHL